jgi:hypothetical protein
MVHTNNSTHNITTTTPATTSSRWIPKTTVEESTEDKKKQQQRSFSSSSSSAWTEVVSKHHKRHPNDPFAGMKSSVDYEQEIERLKQLVPKVPSSSLDNNKKYNNSSSSSSDSSSRSTTPPNLNHSYRSSISNKQQQAHEISRSNSPDTTHSSDSDISLPEPPSQQTVTEQEKARFLAFVRSWTGDYKGTYHNQHYDIVDNNSNSLWAQQTPWDYAGSTANDNGIRHQHGNALVISMPATANNQITTAANAAAAVNNTKSQFDLYWKTTVQTTTARPYYTNYQSQPNSSSASNRHYNQLPPPSAIGMGRTSRGRNNLYPM